ncbi:hypothetical protein HKI87_12g71620 [Chloropicon roscoffensis]|uniref:Uncharacterized protein n=1 Tax=Chloropicon roscoffensis TaxID=1461544 RepID=A0AAX4PGT1_9CHLO|mmetsp:Transcript_6268/g.18982  ORF Transcript_6268/g.18982 Transcript_6268/m.18982 type:complete len:366 (-) Transcript_6268:152-1249(-)|eukprot:CAMPEP_0198462438 /NCGR_PEP_ID=MMETSP1456-20131121/925_1 /TAXON_ID=1461544 ORGANISM="Unidentified sp., Strain RCC1871" /NCGR_SAMPLE_ID=MMETSP1456 /ASSEMBLY_ACC=CAM_ASM_001119 /LENGTH=365 /DNA_ID=CAMNT_0044187641 /DNA_START=499 /DNA_END=1596 /DNA_ORIENTATION=+
MARAKNDKAGGEPSKRAGGAKGGLAGADTKVNGEGKGKKGAGKLANDGPDGSNSITCADIQYVQNLIERCLQQYMTEKDVIFALQYQARIEPGFTQLVWQKLEEQNPGFFMAYHVRVKLKDQIVLFNHLLEQQMQMMKKLQTSHLGPQGWQQKAGGLGQGPIQHPHLGSAAGFPMHHPMHHHSGPMGHHGGMMPHHMDHPGMGHHPHGGMAAASHGLGPHSNNPMAPHGGMPYGYLPPHLYGAEDRGQGKHAGQMREHAQGNPSSVFSDYNQGRMGGEAPPFAAGLGRPSSIGLDMNNAEGQSNMNMNGMPKVFSLSDLTMELGAQLGTDGDVSLSLLAGNESSGLGGIFPRNLSLGDIAKLETM